jgi:hypothetical protein
MLIGYGYGYPRSMVMGKTPAELAWDAFNARATTDGAAAAEAAHAFLIDSPRPVQDGEVVLPNPNQRGGGLHRYPQHNCDKVYLGRVIGIRSVGNPPLGLLHQRRRDGVSCVACGACGDELGLS